ncbi:MAG: Rrf2 family transcriptional regulator [Gemmatimonadota bacterium]|jgi:Rrf2 family protein|nr:Rrf2 family transcriptional regulator [Gemmatimonadota bacterium]MDP6528064.1 Rrf2 family transcriptional regulator [Gemmatimonadota bacterium]MDP6803511.1 Rrf2 family transcriptional regulator [Gemmatimonadota bacterium]
MNLSRSSCYAIYAVVDMAMSGGRRVTVASVADRHGIPPGALAKVFQHIVRAKLAVGVRGVGGGYSLSRKPSDISLLEVIETFQAPRFTDRAMLPVDPPGPDGGMACHRVLALFDEMDEAIRTRFASVSIADLIR